jgi:hypothetical protein
VQFHELYHISQRRVAVVFACLVCIEGHSFINHFSQWFFHFVLDIRDVGYTGRWCKNLKIFNHWKMSFLLNQTNAREYFLSLCVWIWNSPTFLSYLLKNLTEHYEWSQGSPSTACTGCTAAG